MNILVTDKSKWPKTVDGTTDWEALFDNGKIGLIAAVSASETPEQLKQQTGDIVRLIFNRKRDQPTIAKVTAFLDKLIPPDASPERLPDMRAHVIKMLGKAKEDRIKRAAAFVEKKAKQKRQKKSKKKINRRPGRIVGFFRRNMDVLALALSLFSRVTGDGAARAGKGSKKSTEEVFFKQDAYVHDGGGDTEWQDSDMYAMKEKETEPVFKDDEEIKEDDDEYDSWDNY